MSSRVITAIIGIALLCGAGYALLGSAFRIRTISLTGLDGAEAEEFRNVFESILGEKRLNIFPQRNSLVLFLTTRSVRARMLKEFPEIESISIHAGFPQTASLEAKERELAGVWCRSREEFQEDAEGTGATSTGPVNNRSGIIKEECFFVDSEGRIFKQAPQLEGGILLRLIDMRNVSVAQLEPILPASDFTALREFKKIITRVPDAAVTEYILSDTEPRVRALMKGGWELYVNFPLDAEYSTAAVSVALREIGKERNRLAYIDLRIKDRAYYAFQDNIGNATTTLP